jgi:hypothetical protein
MNYVTKRDDWTREARRITGRNGVNVYWNREYNYVSIVENGMEKYSVQRWDELGKRKLRRYAFLIRNGLQNIGIEGYKKILQEQEYDKARQEMDWERETHDDIQKFGVREKRHLPLS